MQSGLVLTLREPFQEAWKAAEALRRLSQAVQHTQPIVTASPRLAHQARNSVGHWATGWP
jgi:hypothetical protein